MRSLLLSVNGCKRAGFEASPLSSCFTCFLCCCRLIAALGLCRAIPCAKWMYGARGMLPRNASTPLGCVVWLAWCGKQADGLYLRETSFGRTVLSKIFFFCQQFCGTMNTVGGKTCLLSGEQISTVPLHEFRYFVINQYSNPGWVPQSWIYWEGRRVCSIIFLKH